MASIAAEAFRLVLARAPLRACYETAEALLRAEGSRRSPERYSSRHLGWRELHATHWIDHLLRLDDASRGYLEQLQLFGEALESPFPAVDELDVREITNLAANLG